MDKNTIQVYAIRDTRFNELTTPAYGSQRRTVYQRLSSVSSICNNMNAQFKRYYADESQFDFEPYEVVTFTIPGEQWETVPYA